MKKVGIFFSLLLLFFLLPKASFAYQVDIEPTSNHIWQLNHTEYINTPFTNHEYKAWHHFIQKTVTCQVTKQMKIQVEYCKIHDHYQTNIEDLGIVHSKKHR